MYIDYSPPLPSTQTPFTLIIVSTYRSNTALIELVDEFRSQLPGKVCDPADGTQQSDGIRQILTIAGF